MSDPLPDRPRPATGAPEAPGFADDDARRARAQERADALDRALAAGRLSEADWYAAGRALFARTYLATDDTYRQSGMRADAARWERGRRPIVAAIDRDGTFLDVSCANGLLMESVVAWAAAAGHRIEPFGLDHAVPLADLARQRLPGWADRIFVGNAVDWTPPHRFDFVRTELVYVPPARRPALVDRLLTEVVAPGGRLVVCAYGSSRPEGPRVEPIGDLLRSWGLPVADETEGADANGVPFVRAAWLDAPPG